MSFDFDRIVDRHGTSAVKWDSHVASHGQPAPGDAFTTGDGPPPIAMSIADMEFPAPACVTQAMMERVGHGIFGYTLLSPAYREAVAAWHQDRHAWNVDPGWVMTHHGVIPTLYLIIRSLLPAASGIVLQTPAFPPFFDAITRNHGRVLSSELPLRDGRYCIDFADLERACSEPDAAMLILCNPHNPVGRCFTAHELARVAEICARHDVLVFADEIHGDLVVPGHRFTPFLTVCDGRSPRTIVACGLSKTMNLAGLHLNNVIIPDASLREAFENARSDTGEWGVNPVSEAGLLAGYRHGGPWLDGLMDYVEGNMRHVHEVCCERIPELVPAETEGTYLQWIDMRALGLDDAALLEYISTRARVRLESGGAFGAGGSGFMRMNLACPRAMVVDAIARLERVVRANDRPGLTG